MIEGWEAKNLASMGKGLMSLGKIKISIFPCFSNDA